MEMIKHRISEHKLAALVGAGLIVALGFFVFNQVGAHEDPSGCAAVGNAVGINLNTFRFDGTTPVGAGTVTDGELIVYKSTLSPLGSNCSFQGGTWTITTPDGAVTDVTPGGGIPQIGGSGLASLTSAGVSYTVLHANEFTDAGLKKISATAIYTGGTSHDGGDSSGAAGSIGKTNTVIHTPTVVTEIHNASEAVVTTVPAGTIVHDKATVSNGGPGIPAGTVDFTFYTSNNCTTGGSPSGTGIVLDGSGVAHPSTSQGPLAVGLFSFKAHYNGETNKYTPADSDCEPLSVVDARITISQTDTNEVNNEHTFTVFVEKNDGTGWVDAAGVTINSTETGVGSITGGTCGPSGPTDVNGECTVIVNSASAGTITVNASGTVNVGGVNINVATDGYGAHNISNQKTWVDAKITISPDGTNPVNAPHTFTVTVMKDPGTGMLAAAGEHVDFTLTDGGGAVAVLDAANSTCDDAGPNTDVNGQCVIVFTSATAGTTVGNASVTLTVGGVVLTRDTDPATALIGAGPGGSGPALKTWVSFTARMTTTIHDAQHNAVLSVPAGSTVHDSATVSGTNGGDPVPTGDVEFEFFSGAGANLCQSASVPSGTVTLDGSGVAHPSDPQGPLAVGLYAFRASYVGDSNYPDGAISDCEPLSVVDARITISQTDTNEVNNEHTFTVFVEKNDGTGWVDAAGVTINSTESGVGSITGGTCGPTGPTDVNGECTVIVNSASAGVSTVQASGTVNVGGVNVDVATNGHGAHDISNQKTWVDANITISPDGTNNVNDPHTFTVTVMKDPGTGMVAAAGEHVDFTLTDGGGAVAVLNAAASTCDDAGPNTDVSGQCTIVFTSATAGTTVGNASVTLTVGGVPLTRDTDPATVPTAGPGGSGPATKTWEAPQEGCTPGYWKNHPDSWVPTGFTTGQTLESVFDVPDAFGLDNATLLQALSFPGGPGAKGAAQILLRAAVAALLNAAHPDVDYPMTEAQIIAAVNAALASGDRTTILNLASDLDAKNNLGCPIDAQGNPIVLATLAPLALMRRRKV